MKKWICIFLCLCMMIPLPCFASASEARSAYPTVYVKGQGDTIVDENGDVCFPVSAPDGYIVDAVKACMPSFVAAVTFPTNTNKEAYAEKLSSYVSPIFEKVAMDKNGNPQYGTVNPVASNAETLEIREDFPDTNCYDFKYDFRRSHFENAEILHGYIATIKEKYHVAQVNLVGRCEGSCVVLAYLAEYGYDDIRNIMFLDPACNGFSPVNGFFTGKIHIDADSVERFSERFDSIMYYVEDVYVEFLVCTVQLANAMYGLDLTGKMVGNIFNEVLYDAFPDLLLNSFASMPGIWGMLNVDCYDDAIAYIFAEEKATEYTGLIEKIQYYHDTVSVNTVQLLQDAEKHGIKIGCMTKYGIQGFPLFDDSDELSDGKAVLQSTSFGATTAKMGRTFTETYLSSAADRSMISPDGQVDVSTCLFPETTWFVKNLYHDDFPWQCNEIAARFFAYDGQYTVDTDETYPAFMIYEDNEFKPMDAENAKVKTEKTSSFRLLLNFFKTMFAALKNLFQSNTN